MNVIPPVLFIVTVIVLTRVKMRVVGVNVKMGVKPVVKRNVLINVLMDVLRHVIAIVRLEVVQINAKTPVQIVVVHVQVLATQHVVKIVVKIANEIFVR